MHPAVSNGSYDVARVREDFPALALTARMQARQGVFEVLPPPGEGGRVEETQELAHLRVCAVHRHGLVGLIHLFTVRVARPRWIRR